MVVLDNLDDDSFTLLCSENPKAARELIRGLALKISPDALAAMYKKLSLDGTAPADVIKIASEVFSIAGVRQAAQEGVVNEPKFTVMINLGPVAQPEMKAVTITQGPSFDDIVLAPEAS
jgi:hypothetical protein